MSLGGRPGRGLILSAAIDSTSGYHRRPNPLRGSQDAAVVSLSYLFAFGAAAALIPFVSIYYKSIGFGAGTIGWLIGLPLLVNVVAAPLWGGVADATHRHRVVLALAVGGAAALAGLIAISHRFWILLLIVLLHAAVYAPVMSLIDNGALILLAGRPADYGRFRFWGTVGWGVSALGVGWLVSAQGARWIFAVYIALMVCLLVCAVRLPVGERPEHGRFGDRIALLARDGRMWMFLGVAFLGGIGISMVNAYLPLYLNGMHATGLVGVALLIATISEMPVMLLGRRILIRIGFGRAFVLALMLYGVRALALSLAHTPWIVLALQLLHGPTFALMWLAGVALARGLAPAGIGATAQGLFASVSNGLGGACGAVLGGWVYGTAGPAATFRVAALILAVVVPVLAIVGGRPRRRALG
ncbi:MAG: transporter, family, 3-phenylpropionic acid transporter [Gaiellales bacterium]|nr:transporter, family, 3-phenylpropionic acid transporter [Gaiellales bacterium]MDX6545226.1 transporter, family, 3-phenylpropionic acid transporter [Gaiellales bacterium]